MLKTGFINERALSDVGIITLWEQWEEDSPSRE